MYPTVARYARRGIGASANANATKKTPSCALEPSMIGLGGGELAASERPRHICGGASIPLPAPWAGPQ